MAYQESHEIELTLNPADYDFDLATPKPTEQMANNPESRTPFQYQPNPDHVVVSEFRLDDKPKTPEAPVPTPQQTQNAIINIEFYSKNATLNSFQFLTVKTTRSDSTNWYSDPRFIELHIQQFCKDIIKMSPYNIFALHNIKISFHNPEVTFYYIQNRRFNLMRYTHPASQNVQQTTPPPFPQIQGNQTFFRIAVYVEIRTESYSSSTLSSFGFSPDEEPYLVSIINNIRRIRNVWQIRQANGNLNPPNAENLDQQQQSCKQQHEQQHRHTDDAATSAKHYRNRSRPTPRRSRSPAAHREHRPGHHHANCCSPYPQQHPADPRRSHRDQQNPNRTHPDDLRHSLTRRERISKTINNHQKDDQPAVSPQYHQWDK